MVRLIIQNIWADRGKMQYLVIYYFIYSNIILQLSKPGSFIERLQYHWDFFILFFKYIFLLYIIVIIISQLYRSDTINETKPLILTSYTGRIIYAVLGSVGLLLGIAELIWFYVPYKNPLYIKAIGLFFNAGYWGWIVAVFDQTTKKAKWSMLIRSNAIENETTTYAKKNILK